MINRQDQKVSDNAIAVQAGGSVTIHKNGLDVADVKELALKFLEKHLPALREEAAAIARQNANDFMEKFVSKLADSNTVTAHAFSRPDSQACFSNALRDSAEKGDQIDLEFLASMVVRRLEADADPLMKLVYEEAISVLPKLTSAQIAFLVFIHFIRQGTPTRSTAIDFERTAELALPVISPGFGISSTNKDYLCSKGVISINVLTTGTSIIDHYSSRGMHFPDEESLQPFPCISSVIKHFNSDQVQTCYLTATGKIIALSALEKAFGKVDLSIWIN